jgi:hypothetical protein
MYDNRFYRVLKEKVEALAREKLRQSKIQRSFYRIELELFQLASRKTILLRKFTHAAKYCYHRPNPAIWLPETRKPKELI